MIFDQGEISGDFDKQEIEDLVAVLNAGALSVTFKLVKKQLLDKAPSAKGEAKALPMPEANAHFIGRLQQGTVELIAITKYPPTNQSQWWKPDGSAAHVGPFRSRPTQSSLSPNEKPLAFYSVLRTSLPTLLGRSGKSSLPRADGWPPASSMFTEKLSQTTTCFVQELGPWAKRPISELASTWAHGRR